MEDASGGEQLSAVFDKIGKTTNDVRIVNLSFLVDEVQSFIVT